MTPRDPLPGPEIPEEYRALVESVDRLVEGFLAAQRHAFVHRMEAPGFRVPTPPAFAGQSV